MEVKVMRVAVYFCCLKNLSSASFSNRPRREGRPMAPLRAANTVEQVREELKAPKLLHLETKKLAGKVVITEARLHIPSSVSAAFLQKVTHYESYGASFGDIYHDVVVKGRTPLLAGENPRVEEFQVQFSLKGPPILPQLSAHTQVKVDHQAGKVSWERLGDGVHRGSFERFSGYWQLKAHEEERCHEVSFCHEIIPRKVLGVRGLRFVNPSAIEASTLRILNHFLQQVGLAPMVRPS